MSRDLFFHNQHTKITLDTYLNLLEIDFENFRLLDDRIGCPDCADGGAEWIQVNWSGQNKRVTFENGQLIKGFEGLVVKLRDLRNKYTNNL